LLFKSSEHVWEGKWDELVDGKREIVTFSLKGDILLFMLGEKECRKCSNVRRVARLRFRVESKQGKIGRCCLYEVEI
jgi:hypothetical protein